MTNPELSLPGLSLTQRLTFDVADVLKVVRWDYRPDSGLEVRARKIPLGGGRLITVRQVRTLSAEPLVRNSVRLEESNGQLLAAWMTGSPGLHISDFENPVEIENLLQETKALVCPDQNAQA
jgi:hypothetical protein